MKVIFLDFDGVLNSERWEWKCRPKTDRLYDSDAFDPAAVSLLNDLLEKTRAKIVVSSSWRRFHSVLALKKLLEEVGVKGEVIDMTPRYLGVGKIRGDEIRHWLDEHADVTSFVILDDSDDMEPVKDRLVLIDWRVGLTESGVTQAALVLNQPIQEKVRQCWWCGHGQRVVDNLYCSRECAVLARALD